MKKNGAFKAVSMMMLITLFGKALGLLRDSFVGSYYGTASIEGAAFNYASILPRQFMDVLFASAISASFIPVFNAVMEREGQEKAFRLSHNFISLIVTLSGAFTILCMVFAHPIVGLFDGWQHLEVITLASSLIKILFPTILVGCLAFSLTGILQSMGEFNIPAAMALSSNAVILVYYFFGMEKFGVFGLCAAYLLGWVAQFLIQIPFLWKKKFRFRFRIDLRDEGLRKIGGLMLPVMVSVWVAPINTLFNQRAALYVGTEAYNAIVYANNIYTIVAGVFVLSVTNVIFPRLSALAANDDKNAFGETMNQTLRAMLFFLIPMALGLMAMSRPIVRLMYERGQFTALSTDLTSSAMIFFSAGIPGFGLQMLLTRGFYAFQEGKTPMLAGLIAMAVNIALSFILVRNLGVGGPALANSIALSLVSMVMLFYLNAKVKGIINKKFLIDLLKMLAAGLIMLAGTIFSRQWLEKTLGDSIMGRLLVIGAPVAVGLAIYIGAAALLRLPETAVLFKLLKHKKSIGK